mmetsp:Transcript_26122/g.37474  ORF Transcript_26122/g.37474 Transcript_26122/m.37474 type:complete len:888 (+) Transcript_26122:179-2842(+)
MEATRHIAAYGFYLRDMLDIQVTYEIESAIKLAQQGSLFRTFKHATLGMQNFAGTGSRSGATLGPGDTKLLWSSIYGRGHMLLKGNSMHSNTRMNFSSDQLHEIRDDALNTLQNDILALYTLFEWSGTSIEHDNSLNIGGYHRSINQEAHWKKLSALNCLQDKHNEPHINTPSNHSFLQSLMAVDRTELLQQIDQVYIQPHRLSKSQVECLLCDGWPLIVATDGGATKLYSVDNKYQCASASVVILRPPDMPFACYMAATEDQQITIMNANLMPWMARATPLPPAIGNCTTDNAHAECLALIILEEWIPYQVPVLIIMDSETERERYQHLRQKENTTNRFLIRSIMSGVSKCLGSRLAQAILNQNQNGEQTNIISPPLFHSSIFDFCLHAKQWCFNKSGEESLWKRSQWESNTTRAIWAIRSHQLNEDLSISLKNRYGTNIIPNRSFVSANQWADNICNAILRFQRNAYYSKCPRSLRKWLPPVVTLGITGPTFSLTYNGVCLDRSVSIAVEHICEMEFVKRLATRPTQGLIIRLRASFFLKPEMIGRQSYHRRSLEGKSKTHTRAMYTDSDYRKAIVYTYAKLESWHDNSEKFTSTLKTATKTYSFLCCPCCITTLNPQCNSNAFDEQPGHLFLLKDGAVINSGLYGNLRHYRFHCLNEDVQAVRNKMTHLLENHLTALFRIASKWGRQGFSTLLTRAINALIALDRSPYHNASSNNYMHMKTLQSQYACLTSEDWITFIETQNSTAQDNFMQWPLTHQLGFIPANCYSLVELADGDHSPCDLISMGIIPLTLQEVILQFAKELGVKQCQETKKDFMQQWHQVRAAALLRAISVAMAAGAHVAEYKSSLLPTLPASLLLATADLTTANSPNPQLIQQTSAIPPGEN